RLTGRSPFPSERPVIEELLARQREPPLPLRQARSDIPAELEALVVQMMALDPAGRYPTPAAVMSVLHAFLEHTSGSDSSGAEAIRPRSDEPVRRTADLIGYDLPPANRTQRSVILSPSAATRAT